MTTAQIQLPKKLISVFVDENVRYRGAHGGRGSAKTRSFAFMTTVKGYQFAEYLAIKICLLVNSMKGSSS